MATRNFTARKTTHDQPATREEFMRLVEQLTETQTSLMIRYGRYLAALKPGGEVMPVAKFIETLPKRLIGQFRPLIAGLEVHHG